MTSFMDEIKDESLDSLDSFFEENFSDNNENQNKKSSNKILVSYSDNKKLIDTLFDWNKTQFVEYNKETNNIFYKQNIKIKDILYSPLRANSWFIENWLIIFSWWLTDYWEDKDLIEEIKAFIHKYVDIQEELEIVCVYYILMTYFFDKFTEVPYLRVIWDYWSWKSRFLKTIWWLCYNPIMVNGWLSSSALFRILDMVKGTLVFDEADLKQSDTTNEVVKILNNWYQKWQSIIRADWNKFEVNSYSVFWPKVIWSREDFKDKALESRCITFIMKRTNRDDIKRNLDEEFEKEASELRNKLINYRYKNYNNISLKEEVIEWLEPRLNQIINPILSIIKDEDDKIVVILNSLNYQTELKNDRFLSAEWQIFRVIYDLLQNTDTITYSDILDELWFEYKLHPRKLWAILKNHWINSHRTNKWFKIDVINNKDVLEKHYKAYSIND